MSRWFEQYGCTEVADGLLMGAYPQDAEDVAVLAGAEVTRVLNLVQDREYGDGAREACAGALAASAIAEERIDLVDFGGLPLDQLEQAVTSVLGWLQDGECVYVHCRAGRQRSATVVAGVLALREQIGLLEALDRIRRRRPDAEPLAHQREDLAAWWTGRRSA